MGFDPGRVLALLLALLMMGTGAWVASTGRDGIRRRAYQPRFGEEVRGRAAAIFGGIAVAVGTAWMVLGAFLLWLFFRGD